METTLNEVFTINDMDSGEVMYIYLTNDAMACYDVMLDVDNANDIYSEDKDERRISRQKENYFWIGAFERECKRRKIAIKSPANDCSYEY